MLVSICACLELTALRISAGLALPPVTVTATALSPINIDLIHSTQSRRKRSAPSRIRRQKRSGTTSTSSAEAGVEPTSNVGDTPSVSVSAGT